MAPSSFANRSDLQRHQAQRLAEVLERAGKASRFYQAKWRATAVLPATGLTIDDLPRLPLTTKDELLADQAAHPPYGSGLTEPIAAYTRLHQTSGTKGTPLRWLDTPSSWEAMLGCWRQIYTLAGVKPGDRIFFPFSFGPFLGFWTAFDAASRLGLLCIPGGGLSTLARLHMLLDHQVTVLCCTPTYALHLAQVAQENGIDLTRLATVRLLIVAGEPGGSIPATRSHMERAWNARVIDHSGLTEIGPLATEAHERPGGLYVLEGDYVVEFLDPTTQQPVPTHEIGELVVTNLGRIGSPLIRYRTGDLVRAVAPESDAVVPFVWLEGGILGRLDDMISVRGNNFYPSSLEAVLRRFGEIVEYRVEVDSTSSLAELRVEIEATANAGPGLPERVARAIRDDLLFRADVALVPPGSLPRFEMKANRVRRK